MTGNTLYNIHTLVYIGLASSYFWGRRDFCESGQANI